MPYREKNKPEPFVAPEISSQQGLEIANQLRAELEQARPEIEDFVRYDTEPTIREAAYVNGIGAGSLPDTISLNDVVDRKKGKESAASRVINRFHPDMRTKVTRPILMYLRSEGSYKKVSTDTKTDADALDPSRPITQFKTDGNRVPKELGDLRAMSMVELMNVKNVSLLGALMIRGSFLKPPGGSSLYVPE